MESYTEVRWHEVRPGERFRLNDHNGGPRRYGASPSMPPSGRLPCYAKGSPPRSGVVVGYRISDARTNRVGVLRREAYSCFAG